MLIHGGSLLFSHSLQFFPHASLLCGSTIRTASFSFKRSCVPEFRNPRSVGDDDRHGERRSGWEDRIGMKEEVEDEHSWMKRVYVVIEAIPEGNSAIISASLVGVLTGICVVLFNNSVNEIRDFFWDGIPDRGASWLREAPIEETWKRTILVPVCGGVFVGMLNVLRDALDGPTQGVLVTRAKAAFAPLLKSLAACITLGTGNSLGPEGPSVEIGSAIAKGIGTLFDRRGRRKVPLIASGSAAGISSGFNAAVAGCFFGVESVLWPSPSDSSVSLTNTTSMVILSAVIASVLSEVGLGGEPAFKVPDYDFRSTSELPLYLLLGILCGLVSLALTRCTSYMLRAFDNVHKDAGLPRAVFPAMGGLFVGIIALAYPEILYWGFENVDILLESQPSVKGLSADLLLQLVAVKIIATSFCRASGLVGGYYAPSLFIGAATGMAYGKLIALMVSQSHPSVLVSFFEVASPQAYGLVGMAATLAGVCQVPLTSVLLLFELTQDYRIVLPLLGAVGFSSWITSSPIRRKDYRNSRKLDDQNDASIAHSNSAPSGCSSTGEASNVSDLCEVESSLCIGDSDFEMGLDRRIYVSHAMRTRYATVLPSTLLIEAVALMLVEKQSYAVIVNDDNMLIGLISLEDIRGFSKSAEARSRRPDELMVAEMCDLDCRRCRALATVIPDMDLYSAEIIMSKHDLNLLPVVSEHGEDSEARVVGVIDRDCIRLVRQAVATTEYLYNNLAEKHEKPSV